jgi:hypothetical protein
MHRSLGQRRRAQRPRVVPGGERRVHRRLQVVATGEQPVLQRHGAAEDARRGAHRRRLAPGHRKDDAAALGRIGDAVQVAVDHAGEQPGGSAASQRSTQMRRSAARASGAARKFANSCRVQCVLS